MASAITSRPSTSRRHLWGGNLCRPLLTNDPARLWLGSPARSAKVKAASSISSRFHPCRSKPWNARTKLSLRKKLRALVPEAREAVAPRKKIRLPHQADLPCPDPSRKIFRLTRRANHLYKLARLTRKRGGSRSSRTCGGMRWTRQRRARVE